METEAVPQGGGHKGFPGSREEGGKGGGLSRQRYEPMGRCGGVVRTTGNSQGSRGRLVTLLPGTGQG